MKEWVEKQVQISYDDASKVKDELDITLSEAILLLISANVNSISYKLFVMNGGEDGKQKGSKGFTRR